MHVGGVDVRVPPLVALHSPQPQHLIQDAALELLTSLDDAAAGDAGTAAGDDLGQWEPTVGELCDAVFAEDKLLYAAVVAETGVATEGAGAGAGAGGCVRVTFVGYVG